MSISIPQHLAALRVYQPGKPIEELERELGLKGSLKLASNENPLGPSPRALAAMGEAAGGVHRYPDSPGFYLKRRLSEIHGLPTEAIVLGNGSSELVEMLSKAFLCGRGNAVLSEGAFILYRIAVLAAGGEVRSAPMTADLRHDLQAMARAIDGGTRLVYIANPNNPTGTYNTEEEVRAFLERVPEDVIVVLDEAYREYIDVGDYPASLACLKAGRNLVILRTFSKIHGLAGLRVGYGLMPPAVAAIIERVRSPFNTSLIGQCAALAALDDEAHIELSRRNNAEGLSKLRDGLTALEVRWTPSVANFMLIHPPCDATRLYDALLHEGVIVRPMGGWGFPGSLRVSIGRPEENERFLQSLARCLAGVGGRAS